jgi:hypothetical protein
MKKNFLFCHPIGFNSYMFFLFVFSTWMEGLGVSPAIPPPVVVLGGVRSNFPPVLSVQRINVDMGTTEPKQEGLAWKKAKTELEVPGELSESAITDALVTALDDSNFERICKEL